MINIDEIISQKEFNNIFYHMYCINDAVNRFQRTYTKIKKSGLIYKIENIYVNCVGPKKKEFSSKIINNEKVKIYIGNNDKDESEILNTARIFAKNNPIGNILYLHSKGVYRNYLDNNKEKTSLAVTSWIDCMEYFLIENYLECLYYLKEYDNCGILYMQNKTQSWYQGNFWWTTNYHLSKVKECRFRTRWDGELDFLFSRKCKHKELYNYSGDVYRVIHDRKNYTQKDALV